MSRLTQVSNEACIAAYLPPPSRKQNDRSVFEDTKSPSHPKPHKKPRSDLSQLKNMVSFFGFLSCTTGGTRTSSNKKYIIGPRKASLHG